MNSRRSLGLCIGLLIFYNTSVAQLTYKELQVEYDSAWKYKNLEIIPVRFKGSENRFTNNTSTANKPLLFSEALQKHKVKLQEMQYENGADVNWLQVSNHSKQNVIIQSGEIVDGGKQDRMMGETKIIAPGTSDYIHVYCVEKRRWSDKPKEFRPAGVADTKLRKAMDVAGRQNEVWKEIDRQYAERKKKSETFSYLELYKDSVISDTGYINFFVKKYSKTDSAFAGFIFMTGDKILSTELFASSELTNIAFRNMLSSYVQTVRESGAPPIVALAIARDFMDKILVSEASQKAYVTAHGKLHVKDGKMLHLIAYDN